MIIRKANLNEATLLRDLSVRSKAFWGYDDAFMRDAVDDLTLNPKHIESDLVYLCEDGDRVLGYYAFSIEDGPEMIALFVEPDFIGKGIGSNLWKHSLNVARDHGWNKFKVVADPFAAEKFYLRVGCKQVGEYQSPVRKDRKLPLLEFSLGESASW